MRRAQPWVTNRARVLRANASSAEDLLWQELRARRLAGHKFVRQAPIDRYFADFLCRDLKLVIEVDGGTHGTDAEIAADATRNLALESQGYFIFRVHNQEIYENLSGVLESLHEVIANRQRTRSRPSS